MLTLLNHLDYAHRITGRYFNYAKSVVGIDNLLFKSAKALIRSAFFMPTHFMVGCIVALRSADLLNGIINSVQFTTLIRLITIGGDSQIQEVNTMSPAITIASKKIRELSGLYSLNDLHIASGKHAKDKPYRFIRNAQTQELIKEIDQSPNVGFAVKTQQGGKCAGTYAHKYLVYAYAMWISPKFHLHVIKAFDKPATLAPLPNPANVSIPKEYLDLLYTKINLSCTAYNTMALDFAKLKDTFYETHDTFIKLSALNELTQLNPTFKTAD